MIFLRPQIPRKILFAFLVSCICVGLEGLRVAPVFGVALYMYSFGFLLVTVMAGPFVGTAATILTLFFIITSTSNANALGFFDIGYNAFLAFFVGFRIRQSVNTDVTNAALAVFIIVGLPLLLFEHWDVIQASFSATVLIFVNEIFSLLLCAIVLQLLLLSKTGGQLRNWLNTDVPKKLEMTTSQIAKVVVLTASIVPSGAVLQVMYSDPLQSETNQLVGQLENTANMAAIRLVNKLNRTTVELDRHLEKLLSNTARNGLREIFESTPTLCSIVILPDKKVYNRFPACESYKLGERWSALASTPDQVHQLKLEMKRDGFSSLLLQSQHSGSAWGVPAEPTAETGTQRTYWAIVKNAVFESNWEREFTSSNDSVKASVKDSTTFEFVTLKSNSGTVDGGAALRHIQENLTGATSHHLLDRMLETVQVESSIAIEMPGHDLLVVARRSAAPFAERIYREKAIFTMVVVVLATIFAFVSGGVSRRISAKVVAFVDSLDRWNSGEVLESVSEETISADFNRVVRKSSQLISDINTKIGQMNDMRAEVVQSEQELRGIFDQLPSVVMVFDGEAELFITNSGSRAIATDVPSFLEGKSVLNDQGNSTTITVYDAVKSAVFESISTRNILFADNDLVGDVQRTILVTVRPVVSSSKKIAAILIAEDFTEFMDSKDALARASKLEVLGEVSSGMAHELNQPLNMMRLTTAVLTKKMTSNGSIDSAYLLDKLEKIDNQIDRAGAIVHQLKSFGNDNTTKRELCNSHRLIEDSLELAREEFEAQGISIVYKSSEQCAELSVNVYSIEQVLCHVLNNARDAVLLLDIGKREIVVAQEVTASACQITVFNRGSPIPQYLLEKAMEPFFTTKPIGQGTGLGLSISYGIVKSHFGDLAIANVKDGVLVTITLPINQSLKRPVN